MVRWCGQDKIIWCKRTAQKRRLQGYLKSLRKRHFASKIYNMQNNSKPDDGVINKISKKNHEKQIAGAVNKLFYGQDRKQHVTELLVGKCKVERAIQHLYLLELLCDINE